MQTATATKTAPPRASKATPAPIGADFAEKDKVGEIGKIVDSDNFAKNGQLSEIGQTFRRQPNPPAPVQIETPETVFSAAVRSINKRFQLGTLEYIEDHAHELAEEIRLALDRLDLIWSRWIPGADLQPFKRALRTYYNLIIRAVDIFEGATNGKKTE